MSLLEVRGMRKSFGGVQALTGVDLDVDPGHVTALIGPNGAGKTTLFNCVTGALEPDEGSVRLDGASLDDLEVHARARAGLGRTFQRLEIFSNMTVAENLQVAVEAQRPARVWSDLLRWGNPLDDAVDDRVHEVLGTVGLTAQAGTRAGDLSTGQLRMLELGRALCTDPVVLLLDEPASGLDADETAQLDRLLRELARSGLGILLIEHDVDLVLEVSERVYCLDFGALIASGPPAEIAEDPDVRAAYLGVEDEEAVPAVGGEG